MVVPAERGTLVSLEYEGADSLPMFPWLKSCCKNQIETLTVLAAQARVSSEINLYSKDLPVNHSL